jgi:uncharacterized oligopeptide transporter (OPT) family protein
LPTATARTQTRRVTDPAHPLPGAIPTLPADATPEQKDEHWFKYVYQGDRMPQLTLRGILMGSFLGFFMAASNLYTTLKLGWSFGVVVTAVVLSFVLWNGLRFLSGGRLGPMSMLENNSMASCASAAGYSTGSTVGTAVGALLLVNGQHLPWTTLAAFVFVTAALGVFIAVPMKRQMINYEQLPFPTGTAAAETLRSLYTAGSEAMRKAYALLWALLASIIIGFFRTYGTLVDVLADTGHNVAGLQRLRKAVSIPEDIAFGGFLNPLARGNMTGLGFEPSVLLMGAGMLMGVRVCFSMLAGAALLYYVVAPWALAHDAANAGIAGYVPSFTLRPEGSFNPIRWGLWGGTSLMVFASLTTLALDWRTVGRAFSLFRGGSRGQAHAELSAIEVPGTWLLAGLIPFGLGMIAVLNLAFQVSLPLGLVAVLLTTVVSLVCCRATGETDTTPTGAMGKVTQLLFAVLPGAAGNATINLMSAGATSSAGMGSADLLTDLKSGYLLGANPRKQFLAQFIGVFVGTLAILPAWYLMVPTRERLEAFNPPATNMWKAVADLLTQGIHMLPRTAVWLIVAGSLVGILLPVLEKLFPRLRPYLPSAMGLGLSWVVVFQNSLSFALGASLVWLWSRWSPRRSESYSVPIASGFIAGESLIAAAIAIACTLVGLLAAK